jgi:hypothetical protein
MEIHLKIIGMILILLALIHFAFPKYFNWKVELSSLSIINRQLMYVHSYFIALAISLMGLLCITSTSDLINTSLGKRISLGLAIFWGVRLGVQFFGYSSRTWRGKLLETYIHILFTLLWIYFASVFTIIYLA